MPPDRYSPEDYREWLNRAHSSLLHAKMEQPGVYLEDLCYDAQQAAEKALKALLIQRSVRFPYTHNLARLMELLQGDGLSLPPEVKQAAALSDYAIEARYPGLAEPVTRYEYIEAVSMAEGVVNWVASLLGAE